MPATESHDGRHGSLKLRLLGESGCGERKASEGGLSEDLLVTDSDVQQNKGPKPKHTGAPGLREGTLLISHCFHLPLRSAPTSNFLLSPYRLFPSMFFCLSVLLFNIWFRSPFSRPFIYLPSPMFSRLHLLPFRLCLPLTISHPAHLLPSVIYPSLTNRVVSCYPSY